LYSNQKKHVMKTKSIIALMTLITLLIVSCSKNDDTDKQLITKTLTLSETTYKGCFTDNPMDSGKNSLSQSGDSLYYTIANDTLLLHLIVNYNCCGSLNDSVAIEDENVRIYIRDTCTENCICYCMCDFEFEYAFINFAGSNHHFYVYLQGYEQDTFTLWGDLEYRE